MFLKLPSRTLLIYNTVREELESFAVKLAIPNIPKDTLLILKNKLEIYIAKKLRSEL